jgi:ATP phosphoribosyltransferase
LIANVDAWADEWKRRKLQDLVLLLEGAINALSKVGLMMNVERDNLPKVLAVLPALKTPTISSLSDENWVAINTIVEEVTVRSIIPRLKEAGAQGIVEYPLNKIVI